MSVKQEIETWVQALDAYDNQEFDEALRFFSIIADTSKILFNCGVIYATLGEHNNAVECYQRAIGLDQYLAIAYFQQGVSNFLLGDFEEALANFNDTLLYLRGNTSIDYEQLGLEFRLYSCEVLFNRGLCYIYLQQMGPGIQDMEYAAKEKVTQYHVVIDDALRENADGYTVFSIPVGVVYRPNAAKVKNLKAKDYLGKARLVAAADRNQSSEPQWRPTPVDQSPIQCNERASFSASSLVHKNLISRARQQSEPPLTRNVFPPTPPPDERSTSTTLASGKSSASVPRRSNSLRLSLSRPTPLDLSANRDSWTQNSVQEKPRIGTTRTASEPRGLIKNNNQRESPKQHRRFSGDSCAQADAYDSHTTQRSSGNSTLGWGIASRLPPPQAIVEEDEEEYVDGASDAVILNGGFEMLAGPSIQTHLSNHNSHHPNFRRPDVQKFRTKVHAPDDTRYIMIGPNIGFDEFENRVREKFGFKAPLRMRVKDDGDMITMVDQEDLDMLITSAKEVARKEGSEMGKIEIWVEERAIL